jgi:DNA-binding transcriptional LysR family regulator
MVEPRLLRSFVAVAEELHFGRAAARLHLSQPPLSVHVKRLEDDLGVRLLERTRRRVALTAAGAEFLERARRLLDDSARAVEEVQRIARGEAGRLTIGYTATATHAILPALLPRFRARYPAVHVDLLEVRSAQQPDLLRTRRIDVALACGPVDAPGCAVRVLAAERLMVALPVRHPLAARRSIRVRDLQGVPSVAVRRDVEPAWADAAVAALRAAGLDQRPVQETDTKVALLGLVAAGLGVAMVTESLALLGRRGVVFRPTAALGLRLPLVLLEPPEPTAAAAAFASLAGASRVRT